jgi:hypothetical protein
MTTRSWIRRLFARTPRSVRNNLTGYRPRLETLEDRLAPATLTVNSTADNTTDTSVLTLREAIAIVNTSPDLSSLSTQIQNQISGTLHAGMSDTIVFDHTKVTAPITLGGTQLELSLPGSTAVITIDGGAAGVTVDGNKASRIFGVDSGVSAVLSDLTISRGLVINSTDDGGGIGNLGTLTVSNCTLWGNTDGNVRGGGGIYNEGGTLTLSNCTLSGNTAFGAGGGIHNNRGTLTLSNCTLSGNSAESGNGIFTFTDPSGGTMTLNNSIVANSPSGVSDVANDGTLTGSHNLIEDGSGGLSDTITGDPKLGSLASNGGPTQTMALLPGSPAIGGVPANTSGTPSTDQRGFPRNTAAATDIGAFEVQPDFSISVSPLSLTVPPGSSGVATISTAVSAKTAQAVALSAAGLPAGVTASFSPASVTTGGSSTLSLAAAASAAAGTFTVTITGTAASGSHTTTLSLTIGQLAQTINFAPLANQVYGVAPFSLGATASSGLPVTYTISGPAALSGNTLIVTGAGVVDVTASQAGNVTYSAAPPVHRSFTVNQATLTVMANNASRSYGVANPAFTASYNGFVNGETLATAGVTGSPSLTTPASASSAPGSYPITAAAGSLAAGNYTFAFVNGTLSVTPATLMATGVNFSAIAGAPFSGPVATFTTPDLYDGESAFTATINWGDGSSSGVVTGSTGSFTVRGSHTYAAASPPSGYTITVTISNPNTTPNPVTATDTATVTSLGQGVTKGLTGGIGFWHNNQGQALIQGFGTTTTGLTLANWLATTFPNLYGVSAGANNLTGKSNSQVAAFYLSQFDLHGPQAEAQVLATALNVYATTLSLGGIAAQAYGFTVSATGLGARSFNVGGDGAAVGGANNATLNVYQLLLKVNQLAYHGVLNASPLNPGGDATLQAQAADLFDALNQAGSIG